MIDKSTKYCELIVFLKNGLRATGLFHVPMRTSSAIRPSDALQEKKNGLLLLTDVTLYENNTPRKIPAIVMPYDSIAYIELPAGWTAREDSESNSATTPAPTPHPLPFRPVVTPPPAEPASPAPTPHPMPVRPAVPSIPAMPKWAAPKPHVK